MLLILLPTVDMNRLAMMMVTVMVILKDIDNGGSGGSAAAFAGDCRHTDSCCWSCCPLTSSK